MDSYQKNRGANQKLSHDDVREIRVLLAAGTTGSQIARDYGVRPCTINDIKHNRTWSWLV